MIVNDSILDFTITGMIRQLTCLCFGLKILLTKYNLKEWLIIGVIGILGITSYVTMDTKYLIYISVMIFASKGIDSTKVLRYIFYASLAGMILVIVLSLTGIGGPIYDIRDYGRGTIEKRWTLGFNHANNLHGTFWYVISLGLYLYKEKINWIHLSILTILNIFHFLLTVSKTGFIVAQIVI